METLLKLMESGRTAEFLSRAGRELDSNPNAPGLVLLVLKVLVENGFGGPARELLTLRSDLPANNPEITALSHQLEQLPNGRIPWQNLKAQFDANVEAFANRHPEVAKQAKAIQKKLNQHQLLQDRTGDYLFSYRQPGKLRKWSSTFSTLLDEGSLHIPEKGKLGAFLMGGVRYGNLLSQVYDRTKDVILWMCHPIFIVEPDVFKFTAWLHCADMSEILADERVYLFVGDSAIQDFEKELRAEIQLPCPLHNINLSGNADMMHDAINASQRALKGREEALKEIHAKIQERYANRDAAYWAERWKNPRKVFGITSRFTTVLQYSMRDSLAALEEMGWESRLVKETRDHYRFNVLEVLQVLYDFDPDLMLMLDHFRHETDLLPDQMPVLTWVQDMLPNMTNMEAWKKLVDLDFVTGHVRKLATQADFPEERTRHHMTPASEFIFHPAPVPKEEAEELECDLVYAGNLNMTPGEYWEDKWAEVDPRLKVVLDEMRDWVDQNYDGGNISCGFDHPKKPYCSETNCRTLHRPYLRQLLNKRCIKLPENVYEVISETVKCYIDRTFRLETLSWACNWAEKYNRKLKIYGNGWERFDFCKPYLAGFAQHGEPLRRAHRCARLTLSTPSWGTFHQRVFEAVLSGSLVVHRTLPQFFFCRTFEDMVTVSRQHPDDFMAYYTSLWGKCYLDTGFANEEEFIRTCEGLLENQSSYEKVRQDFDQHIRQRHTYSLVLHDCVNMIQENLENAMTMQPASAVLSGIQ